MPDPTPDTRWQVKMVRAGIRGLNQLPDRLGMPELGRIPWIFQPIRPADIVEGLREAMLDRENMLEDVNYQKVIPNRFVVQVAPDNYHRQFGPIEANIVQQWRAKLLEDIITANSRQRKEFRLSGPIRIEVKPSVDLKDTEARILCRINPIHRGTLSCRWMRPRQLILTLHHLTGNRPANNLLSQGMARRSISLGIDRLMKMLYPAG